MKPGRAVHLLTWLVLLLAVVASGTGLLLSGGEMGELVTTVRGQTVRLRGSGLYRHDTLFRAGSNLGSDLVTLFVAVPALVLTLRSYSRGAAAGLLALNAVITWFLYVYASYALGTAYNEAFLVYVALFSSSLYLFLLTLSSAWDLGRSLEQAPRRGAVAAFMMAAGVLTAMVWLMPGYPRLLPVRLRSISPHP